MRAIWNGFLEIIFGAMHFVYSFVGDWGVSIIVVTILFRLLVWPLMVKQVRSMRAMQKLQPLVKEVQAKYADDKEKQSQEMMKLYQEHKVNPFAGCLPMLLQMPLFIGFFAVLMMPRIDDAGQIVPAVNWYGMSPLSKYLGYVEGSHLESLQIGTAKFFGILPDLMKTPAMMMELGWVHALPYIVLLILSSVGVLLPTLMTQKGQNTPQAKQQKMIGYAMAVFMTFIGWSFFPGGVLLYMTTSSLIAAGQQLFVQNQADKEDAAKEAAIEAEKAAKKAEKKKNRELNAGKKKKK
ncbi:MAG: YidC/Oxa1 family membrane protein insertase [Coriobacteriia bacterium]|nr:YidC/Oxa1 family membrane protein insertase [Coriobacteriia bacterium]MCL2537128.1 YidC/Oxa1 family membrane protein insertase [Coriobacteriia bacterium]